MAGTRWDMLGTLQARPGLWWLWKCHRHTGCHGGGHMGVAQVSPPPWVSQVSLSWVSLSHHRERPSCPRCPLPGVLAPGSVPRLLLSPEVARLSPVSQGCPGCPRCPLPGVVAPGGRYLVKKGRWWPRPPPGRGDSVRAITSLNQEATSTSSVS